MKKCNHKYYKDYSNIEHFNYEVCEKCGRKRKQKRSKVSVERVEHYLDWW